MNKTSFFLFSSYLLPKHLFFIPRMPFDRALVVMVVVVVRE